jgi:hypothetical protein
MKRMLRPYVVFVGVAALALLGWSTASAATGSFGRHQVVREVSLSTERHESPEPSPTAEPEVENQAPEAPEEQNEAPEAAENENENEANEQPATTAPPAPPTAPATTSSRTFDLVGGTVTFMCTGNTISLTTSSPNAGFSMETETEENEIKVRFESDTHRSEIRATCVAGQVQATEIREESD